MNGQHIVSGPGTEGRPALSAPAAISLAQGLAAKPGAPLGTWYVRHPDGSVGWHIEKQTDRLIVTTAVQAAARESAPATTLAEVTS